VAAAEASMGGALSVTGFGVSDGRFEAVIEEAFVEVDKYIAAVAFGALHPATLDLPPAPLDPRLCGELDLPCALSAAALGADVAATYRPHARLRSALASRATQRQAAAAQRAAALRRSLEWGAELGLLLLAAFVALVRLPKGRRAAAACFAAAQATVSEAAASPLNALLGVDLSPAKKRQEEEAAAAAAAAGASRDGSAVRALDMDSVAAARSPGPGDARQSPTAGGPLSPVVLASIAERGRWQAVRDASEAFANAPSPTSNSPARLADRGGDAAAPGGGGGSSFQFGGGGGGEPGSAGAGAAAAGDDGTFASALALRALREELADTPDRFAALARAHAALRDDPDSLSAFAELASRGGEEANAHSARDDDDDDDNDDGEPPQDAAYPLYDAAAGGGVRSPVGPRGEVTMLEYCDPAKKVNRGNTRPRFNRKTRAFA
jgi:hypothetical protein